MHFLCVTDLDSSLAAFWLTVFVQKAGRAGLTWLRYTQLGDGTVPYAGHDGAHLALNGLFQSMAWAPLVRTVADLVPGPQCARICLNLATTTPVGTLAAYGICVICISLGNWQRAFGRAAYFSQWQVYFG